MPQYSQGGERTMVDVTSFTGTQIGIRRLELIAALNSAEVRYGYEISTEPYEEINSDYRSDWRVMQEDLRWMRSEGWVSFEESAGGITGVRLLSPGQEAAQQYAKAKADPLARAQTSRDRVLKWLHDCDLTDIHSPTYKDFKASKYGSHLGTGFSDREITKAIGWLVEKELINAQYMIAGYYTYPKVTAAGGNIIEQYGSLKNVPEEKRGNFSQTTVHMNGSHGSNLNIGGNNVTQSTTVTLEQMAEVNKFAESARGLVPLLGLDTQQQDQVLETVKALEEESESPTPKRNVLVELMGKARDLAVLGTASGMVTAFEHLANGAIAAIGG